MVIDNLWVEVEDLKKGGNYAVIIEAEARATEFVSQLEDVE